MKQTLNAQKLLSSGKELLVYLSENNFLKKCFFGRMSENVLKQKRKTQGKVDSQMTQ